MVMRPVVVVLGRLPPRAAQTAVVIRGLTIVDYPANSSVLSDADVATP